jgi:hypothetical protein
MRNEQVPAFFFRRKWEVQVQSGVVSFSLLLNIRRLVFSHRSSLHLASDWNTIWEIFHTPETSSLLMRLADQFCVQDLRSERGLMPIHDVGLCRKTRAARCPSAVSVLFVFLGTPDWLGFHGTLAFLLSLNCIRLHGIVASRTNRRNDVRATKVARQEDMGFSPNSTSNNRQNKIRRFNSPQLNIQPPKQPWIVFFFLLCLLKLDFVLDGNGR